MAEEQQPGEMPNGENGENQTQPGAMPESELETLRAALRKANAEAADRRKKLEQMEAAEKRKADAQLSEVEQAKKRADEAEAKLEAMQSSMRDRAIRHAIEIEASKAGFADPSDAVALADISAVQYDDDGKVSGADAAVKALAKAKPHLVKAAQPPPNTNGRDGGKAQGPSMDEIVARKRSSGMYTPI